MSNTALDAYNSWLNGPAHTILVPVFAHLDAQPDAVYRLCFEITDGETSWARDDSGMSPDGDELVVPLESVPNGTNPPSDSLYQAFYNQAYDWVGQLMEGAPEDWKMLLSIVVSRDEDKDSGLHVDFLVDCEDLGHDNPVEEHTFADFRAQMVAAFAAA